MNQHNQERDALAAGIDELRRRSEDPRNQPDHALVRYRVTALLDSGASLDCGEHLAFSVPQLLAQARRSLNPNTLAQVVNWRLDKVKVESPPGEEFQ